MFKLKMTGTSGRAGTLTTAHGSVPTPFFMPVATAGAMKGITLEDLEALGADILLCNTYHLHSAPGEEIVKKAGGLHGFLQWEKPILTDSGGFQVFSLKGIRKITDEGVHFKDHRSGAARFISPESAIRIQHDLGADIIMCFDECPSSTAPRSVILKAVDRTLDWAERCKKEHEKRKQMKQKNQKNQRKLRRSSDSSGSSESSGSSLFGIVQGGLERDLREKCAQELIALGFDGYALGGLAVGEAEAEMFGVLDVVCPLLPEHSPRYLMGVGDLKQIKKAVAQGIDMFDCVSPMREARHGNVWLSDGTKLRIRRSEFINDHSPIDEHSPAPMGRKHLRSYLHHLLQIGERYGETIACMQNMAVTLEAIRKIRSVIESEARKAK